MENIVVTEKINGKRSRGRPSMEEYIQKNGSGIPGTCGKSWTPVPFSGVHNDDDVHLYARAYFLIHINIFHKYKINQILRSCKNWE